MDLLANDMSIHRQFHDMSSFRDALTHLMAMRNAAHLFGREVCCHRGFLTVEPMQGVLMQEALGRLAISEQRAAMVWLTRGGPFWDDLRRHGGNDYLECLGEIVTDSAVGEAAFRNLHSVECGLVSVTPSDWDYSPVAVTWRREDVPDRHTDLDNWRDVSKLEEMLRDAAPPIRSWDDLRETSTSRFKSLKFAEDCFAPLLAGVPFARSSADRIRGLLDILDRLARAFDTDGVRTPEGQRLYQDYFTGDNALFSDSSNKEKNNFHKELTFRNPNDQEKKLFCTWHGKERHKNLRLHFSWPIQSGMPVYVVYTGPKITKR